jgi:hypothetical protein
MRRRSSSGLAAGFGISFLDLLCSSLGGVVLLLVLNNIQSTNELTKTRGAAKRLQAKNVAAFNTAAIAQQQAADARQKAEEFDKTPKVHGLDNSQRRQLMWHTLTRNLVIVLDLSGSMSRYYPDTHEYAHLSGRMREKGPKWEQAVKMVERILLMTPKLERFVVLGLTADEATNGRPIADPAGGGRWFTKDESGSLRPAITRLVTYLRQVEPRGGSSHYDAVRRTLEYTRLPEAEGAADTIVLITDGLPNHGPGAPAPSAPNAWVVPDDRRTRADQVTGLLENFFGGLKRENPNHSVRFHVVCLPWPDDADLTFYATRWAFPSGGMMLFESANP